MALRKKNNRHKINIDNTNSDDTDFLNMDLDSNNISLYN